MDHSGANQHDTDTDITAHDYGAPPGGSSAWGKDLIVLGLVLLACAPPMLIDLGRRDSQHTMENIAVLSAQETWLRQHGYYGIEKEPDAWLMPTRNGQPRVTKPPMLVWLDLAAWWDLRPGEASPEQLILRARLVSVATGFLLIAATFWAGLTLGDRKLAMLAALVVGLNWFVQRQARFASYDIEMTAWVALSIASALWAMAPFRPPPGVWRQVVGWTVAGLALGAGFMTKQMAAIALLPLIAFLFVITERRRQAVLGIIAMTLIACAVSLPWFVYAVQHDPAAWRVWRRESRAQRDEFQVPWYYLGLFALIAPWTLWLIGGLCQPFMRAKGLERRRLMIAFIWFVTIFVFFSIPGAKQQRYILPIVPAAALLIAQVWWMHHELAERHQRDEGSNLLVVPQWICIWIFTVAVGVFLPLQGWMVERGWLEIQPAGPVGAVPMAVGVGLCMLLAAAGTVWHFQWKPMRAALATAAWAVVMTTLLWHAYEQSDSRIHPLRAEAERIAQIIGDRPLYTLRRPNVDNLINEEFLLYSQRIVPTRLPNQIAQWTDELSGTTYLISATEPAYQTLLTDNGWKPITEFMQDKRRPNWLWKHESVSDEGAQPASDG